MALASAADAIHRGDGGRSAVQLVEVARLSAKRYTTSDR